MVPATDTLWTELANASFTDSLGASFSNLELEWPPHIRHSALRAYDVLSAVARTRQATVQPAFQLVDRTRAGNVQSCARLLTLASKIAERTLESEGRRL
jgi:hypothetical protein